MGWACALAGQRDVALRILQVLEQRREHGYAHPYWIAAIYVGLGDLDQAMVWLEKGYDERDGLMPGINKLFAWDALRDNPRFQALLRRMNFPETTASPTAPIA